MAIRVLIVADHSVIREGLRMFLKDAEIEVVGEAEAGPEAVEMARRLQRRNKCSCHRKSLVS